MTIAIFGNTFRPTVLNIMEIIFSYFNTRKVALLLDKELYTYCTEHSVVQPDQQLLITDDDFHADIALSIGGDGTFLSTAARIGSKNIPIMGINTGRLGFLADVPVDAVEKALNAIMHNQINIEERTLLRVDFSDDRVVDYPYVLNEVSVLKQDSSSMISINTYLNKEAIHSYHADGLIVATPTGSTAYSMSVGGPLMVPQAQNIILSPIASHSLTVRPLVVPDDWIIDLEVFSRNGCYLVTMDGRTLVLEQEVRIRISKADYKIRVAKQLNHTFFDSLKSKLMWGLDKRN
ncbi:MAG: NAD kinase [Paludibacter sp.]|jgi:NAD+ kinase|nr:NAD kinase [Paludibacter sp.]